MKTTSFAVMIAAVVGGSCSIASASVPIPEDPGIFAPCDNVHAEIVWVGSSAGYTGQLSYISPESLGDGVSLLTNKSATVGQRYQLPGTFSQGQRLDFSYDVIVGGLDFFSTAIESDWMQFSVDASNPHSVLVGIEDIRLPGGDSDYNDAQFRVDFSCETPPNPTPSPGTFALLGASGLMLGRRRR